MEKKGKGMKIAHYIITAALVGVVIWLMIAELKRMKTAKEIAAASEGTNGTGTGTTA